MDEQVSAVSWRKFCIILTGYTSGAHEEIVEQLKGVGHIEVDSCAECDYLLAFCPILSRVGTDIDQALKEIPADKPAILVVMHETFDPDRVIGESRKLVNKSNVLLTVDCLVYEGTLLKSNHGDLMWHEIQKLLGLHKTSTLQRNERCVNNPRVCWCTIGATIAVAVVCSAVVAGFLFYLRKQP